MAPGPYARAGALVVVAFHSAGVSVSRQAVSLMLTSDDVKIYRDNLPFDWNPSDWRSLGGVLGYLGTLPLLFLFGARSTLQLVSLPLLLSSYTSLYFLPKLAQEGTGEETGGPAPLWNALFTLSLLVQGAGESISEAGLILYILESIAPHPWLKTSCSPALFFASYWLPSTIADFFFPLLRPPPLTRVLPVLVLMTVMFLYTPLPETPSPNWRMKKKRKDNPVGWTGDHQSERTSEEQDDDGCLRPLLVSCGILLLSQFTGKDVYKFYSIWAFRFAGIKDSGAETWGPLGDLIVRSSGLASSALTLFIYSLAKGPKGPIWMMAVSTGLITGCLFTTGTLLHTLEQGGSSPGWLPLSLYLVHEVSYNCGLGPGSLVTAAWVTRKHLALPPALALRWIASHLGPRSLPLLLETLHPFGVFWLYASLSAVGLLYLATVVGPELRFAANPIHLGMSQRSRGDLLRLAPMRETP